MKRARTALQNTILSVLSLTIMGILVLSLAYIYFESQLPDVTALNNVKMQVPLRVYTEDGKLIAEFGEMRRDPITFKEIPKTLIDAVLATEDKRYFEHSGVDFFGLLRASVELLVTGEKKQGGSTITMQVARNFFLTKKKTYTRKVKEILLAINIDHTLSKEKILELYLNKIFFGNRAYGIGAAAQVYYGKPLDHLTLPQFAMLAGLPKAPSTLNPLADPEAAIARRNHVLRRMYEQGFIDSNAYQRAAGSPLTAKYHGHPWEVSAPYIAEMIRRMMVNRYGAEAYTEGFNVYTTINSKQQRAANKAMRDGLQAYDARHGYRGPENNLGPTDIAFIDYIRVQLKKMKTYNGLQPGVVLSLDHRSALVLLKTNETIVLPWSGMKWAARQVGGRYRGHAPSRASNVLSTGDVIRVEHTKKGWKLAQLPEIEGALVSLNPEDGAIRALVGGFSFHESNFNRAVQAERQPGSNFKPFVYAAALAQGFTLASLINDAPVVVNDYSDDDFWRPQNNSKKFYGPTRLRVGLIRSRNLVSVRLLEAVGIPYAREYLQRFGFDPKKLPKGLSLALGSAVISPLEMASAFSVFANGGYKVMPYLIARITDEHRRTLYRANPPIACGECSTFGISVNDMALLTNFADGTMKFAPRVISPQVAYLITSVLRDVIARGTGRRAKVLGRPDLAGKTGTTNEQNDAWFSGFNSHTVTTVWVGFDQLRSTYEYGSQAALPIWIDFMRKALKGKPEATMPIPPDIISVRIDPRTGMLAGGRHGGVFEVFRREFAPQRRSFYQPEQQAQDHLMHHQGESPPPQEQTDHLTTHDNASPTGSIADATPPTEDQPIF